MKTLDVMCRELQRTSPSITPLFADGFLDLKCDIHEKPSLTG